MKQSHDFSVNNAASVSPSMINYLLCSGLLWVVLIGGGMKNCSPFLSSMKDMLIKEI